MPTKDLTDLEIDAIRAQLALDNFWYYLVEFMEGCEGITINPPHGRGDKTKA